MRVTFISLVFPPEPGAAGQGMLTGTESTRQNSVDLRLALFYTPPQRKWFANRMMENETYTLSTARGPHRPRGRFEGQAKEN